VVLNVKPYIWNSCRTLIRAGIAQSDWLRVGRWGFDSRRGLGIFLFDTVSRPAFWST